MFHQVKLFVRTDHSYSFCRVLCRETTLLVYTNGKACHLGQLAPHAVPHMHITDHSQVGNDVQDAFERNFYVDNWLQSSSSPKSAKTAVNKVRELLASGGAL